MEKLTHHSEQHREEFGNNEQERKIENEPSTVEVFGFLGLLGAGIFAVKKVWQADVGGIQEKTKSVAGELVDQAINTAKKSLVQSFPVKKSPELSNESRKVLVDHYLNKWYKGTETQKPAKEVTVDDTLVKNKITDLEELSKTDLTAVEIEKVLGKDIVNIMDNRDSRFKSLADIDPIFVQKMEHLTSESHEDIASYIRKLDTTSRGAVASAFLSVDLLKDDEQRKGFTDRQLLEKNFDLIDNEDYYKILIKKTGEVGVAFMDMKEEDRTKLIRDCLEEYDAILDEKPKTDIEIMKYEYEKLLLEKNNVQKQLLKMIGDMLTEAKKHE